MKNSLILIISIITVFVTALKLNLKPAQAEDVTCDSIEGNLEIPYNTVGEVTNQYLGNIKLSWDSTTAYNKYIVRIERHAQDGNVSNFDVSTFRKSYQSVEVPSTITWQVRGVRNCIENDNTNGTRLSEWSESSLLIIEDWKASLPGIGEFSIKDLKQTDPQDVTIKLAPPANQNNPKINFVGYSIFIDTQRVPGGNFVYQIDADKNATEIKIKRSEVAHCQKLFEPCLVRLTHYLKWTVEGEIDPNDPFGQDLRIFYSSPKDPLDQALLFTWDLISGLNNQQNNGNGDNNNEVAVPPTP